MDWLQKHLRTFVFPVVVNWNTAPGGDRLKFMTREPFAGDLRPASGCQFPEAGQLAALLMSTKYWQRLAPKTIKLFKAMDVSSIHEGYGSYDKLDRKCYHHNITDEQIVHTTIKNSVKDLKYRIKDGNKVLFLGRDVWLWAVLAEKFGVPHIYDPRVSRNVAVRHDKFAQILYQAGASEGDMLFDTGFAGTIFRNCMEALMHKIPLQNLMLSARAAETQFPNHQFARNRALFIEYLPKYFKTGKVDGDLVVQDLADLDSFVQAALLTIWTWQFESPSWIRGPQLKGDHMKRSRNTT